jgi:hypothetical protein
MTDARFGSGLRAVLTTPEHSVMMDTIEENLAKWIERFNSYKEQNQQNVIENNGAADHARAPRRIRAWGHGGDSSHPTRSVRRPCLYC